MNERGGDGGLDGSSLRVYGYKKDGRNRYRMKGIYRWSAEETAIGDLFKKTLVLSGIKVECYRYLDSLNN